MKKSIKKLIEDLTTSGNSGFYNIKGGSSLMFVSTNQQICNNPGLCTKSNNTGQCTNGTCTDSSNSPQSCTNTVSCFA